MDRRAAEDLRIPSICLMENAGAGAARIALEMLESQGLHGDVVCVAGAGGNGGDALCAARHLAVAGRPVVVLLADPRGWDSLRSDSAVQGEICRAMALPEASTTAGFPAALRSRDGSPPALVIDGIFGTGLTRAPAEPFSSLIEAICDLAAGRVRGDETSRFRRVPVLSLDVPSGLDADTGRPPGACVRADVTATFVAPKLGFAASGAREWTGEVRVVPIGAPLTWPPDSLRGPRG